MAKMEIWSKRVENHIKHKNWNQIILPKRACQPTKKETYSEKYQFNDIFGSKCVLRRELHSAMLRVKISRGEYKSRHNKQANNNSESKLIFRFNENKSDQNVHNCRYFRWEKKTVEYLSKRKRNLDKFFEYMISSGEPLAHTHVAINDKEFPIQNGDCENIQLTILLLVIERSVALWNWKPSAMGTPSMERRKKTVAYFFCIRIVSFVKNSFKWYKHRKYFAHFFHLSLHLLRLWNALTHSLSLSFAAIKYRAQKAFVVVWPKIVSTIFAKRFLPRSPFFGETITEKKTASWWAVCFCFRLIWRSSWAKTVRARTFKGERERHEHWFGVALMFRCAHA